MITTDLNSKTQSQQIAVAGAAVDESEEAARQAASQMALRRIVGEMIPEDAWRPTDEQAEDEGAVYSDDDVAYEPIMPVVGKRSTTATATEQEDTVYSDNMFDPHVVLQDLQWMVSHAHGMMTWHCYIKPCCIVSHSNSSMLPANTVILY